MRADRRDKLLKLLDTGVKIARRTTAEDLAPFRARSRPCATSPWASALRRPPRPRRRTQAFSHLHSHYLFRDRFGRPGKGNDKGMVEALVKTARRRFMVPIPKVHDLSVLNERLTARCLERLDALEQGEQAAALLGDLDALRDLPAAPFEACEHVPGQVSSTALVCYRLVDYSAPAVHAHKKVMVKGYVDRVEIALGAEIVARHNFMRTLALPDAVEQWSLTTLREKLVKIGAKIVRHGRYIVFQMVEVAIPRDLFADILRRIDRLRTTPLPT